MLSTDLLLGDLVGDVCVQQLHHRLAEVARQVVGEPRIWHLNHNIVIQTLGYWHWPTNTIAISNLQVEVNEKKIQFLLFLKRKEKLFLFS